MKLTPEDVHRLAALARLSFSEEEAPRMADELTRILDFVEQLREVDTAHVEPLSHVLGQTNVFRADEPESRLEREAALALAPDQDGTYFRVPKVL